MSKLKPLPKALIVAAVIGVLGYTVSVFLPASKKEDVKSTPEITQSAPTQKAPVVIAPEPIAPTESQKVVIPEVEQARNAGLDKLLNSGNKK